MRHDRYTMDAMTPYEIADMMDAQERDKARRERAARRNESTENETISARVIARARTEEEQDG